MKNNEAECWDLVNKYLKNVDFMPPIWSKIPSSIFPIKKMFHVASSRLCIITGSLKSFSRQSCFIADKTTLILLQLNLNIAAVFYLL